MAVVAVLALISTAGANVQYHDVTEEVSVDFRTAGEIHGEVADRWPGFPEIMGGGACFADLDGDGYDDLYLVNQRFNPHNPFTTGWIDDFDPINHLYLNDGEGGFVDATEGSGLESPTWGYACSVADYDGDRDLDVYVSGFGVSELYRNDGGATFTDVTDEAGVGNEGLCGGYECMGTSTAWADYDLDGDLDLYVGNYVDTTLIDRGRGPYGHTAQFNFLFRNEGDGTFTEVAEAAGVAGELSNSGGGKTLGVVWFDYDLDGDPDLYVANDETPNDFYVNNGDGTFTEDNDAGLDDNHAGMGVTSGDYDGDGYPDLFFTHYEREHNGFYRNAGDGTFERRNGEDGLGLAFNLVGWGAAFVDVDRDGDLDLVATNGHTEFNAEHYGQETKIWRNDGPEAPGDHIWVDITDESGPGVMVKLPTRGTAFADYDLDGDTDMALVSNGNETAQILRASNQINNWLRISLMQPGMNQHGIGARVVLETNGVRQVREIQTGTSYLSQNEMAASFGLGGALKADSITVHWPGGGTTVVTDVAANRAIGIDRALGAVVEDILSPLTRAVGNGIAGREHWYQHPIDLRLEAVDRGSGMTAGVADTMISIDGGALAPYAGEDLSVQSEGVRTLKFYSYDLAGNLEPMRTARVGIDTVAPTTEAAILGSAGDNGWWLGDVRVQVIGQDELSGVAGSSYRVDGGAWRNYALPFILSGDGEYRVEFKSVDRAGNESPVGQQVVRIDSERPQVRLTEPEAGRVYMAGEAVQAWSQMPALIVANQDQFPIRVVAADDGSTVDRVEIRIDGQLRAVLTEAPYEWSWPLADEQAGVRQILARAYDVAGNVRADRADVVLVHTEPGGARAGPISA